MAFAPKGKCFMLFLKLTLLTFGLVYASALSGMFLLQRQLQYFPDRHDPAPAELGLVGVDRLTLPAPDGETLVLWFASAPPGRPVILFLHGNAGSIAARADRFAFYQAQGFGVAFLSYRGYGGSTGHPSETGLLTDAKTAYDHLRGLGIAADHIVLVGESLGTGVAVQTAARNPVGAVVLEAPYTSAADVARRAYPWVPVSLLMKDKYRSTAHIAAIHAPLLILHGERDATIPFGFGQTLFALANEPKTFLSLGRKGHEALSDPATWAEGTTFLNRIFPP